MARIAWSRKLESALLVIGAAPTVLVRPIAQPIAGVSERVVRRNPAATRFPEVAAIARLAAGQRERTAALTSEIGTSPAASAVTRQRLARIALSSGMRESAVRIAESLPDDHSATLEAIRARIAFDGGRYTDAIAHAKRGRPVKSAANVEELATSRLRVLQPEWDPDLGPRATARLAAARGTVTRGRILHIVSSSLPYRQAGYTLRSQSVARCQLGAGLDPHFATRAGFPWVAGVRGALADELVDDIPYHRLAPDFENARLDDQVVTTTAQAAVALVERLRPAALQPASDFLQAQVALALGRELGVPVVYEVRGFLEETWASQPIHADEAASLEADHYRLRRATETRAMAAATAVVTLSQTMRDDMVERGIDPARIVIVPNAVEIERFTPRPRDDQLAASLGIAPGSPVLGYISSFSSYEGIIYLLEAAAALRARGRRLHVLLVGDGKEWDALREAGTRLGLDDGTLVMPGRVAHDQVLRYYSIIDAFVVPRTGHRVSRLVTPLKPYEAMAMERAVVVSDVPALREMVIPGETGLVFRAEDSADLAGVLETLLDDPALRARLGRQAREWVAAERTWAENGRRYRALYERLGVV